MNKNKAFYEKEIARLERKKETIKLKEEYIKLKSDVEPNFFTLLGKSISEVFKKNDD